MRKVEKLNGVEGHADFSIKRIKGSREADVKDVRKERQKVNGHGAVFSETKLDLIKRGLFMNKTRTSQDVYSMHVHCDISSRYFVLYSPSPQEKSEEVRGVISSMVKSFSCH